MTSTHQQHVHDLDMGAQCDFCRGRSFRRSRIQGKDLQSLILLRYPVRCLSCSQRQSVNFLVARRALSSRMKQVRAATDAAAWSTWGSAEPEANPGAPLTVGGKSFSALPMHEPVAMPILRGIVLEHAGTSHTGKDKDTL